MYTFAACLMFNIAITAWMHIRTYKRNPVLFEKTLQTLPNLCKQNIISNIKNDKAIPVTVGRFVATLQKEHSYTIEETREKYTEKDMLDEFFCNTHPHTRRLSSALSPQHMWHAIMYQNNESKILTAIANIQNRSLAPLEYKAVDFNEISRSPSNAQFSIIIQFLGDKIFFGVCNNRLYKFAHNDYGIDYQQIMDKDPMTGNIAPLDTVSIALDPQTPLAFILKNKKKGFIYDLCVVNLYTRHYKKIDEIKSAHFAEHFKPYLLTYNNGLLVVHFKDLVLPSNVQVLTIPTAIYKI